MKKITFFAIGLLAIAACSKDALTITVADTPATATVDVPDTIEDDIANTTFSRTITLTWSASSVAVEGDENGIVSVSGTHVTADNTVTSEKVKYSLGGTCPNGSFKVYSNNKQCFEFNGLDLTNPDGAAINNQGKKRCFVVVNGSNSLADGPSAQYAKTGEEDLKAVFFSEGQLLMSGSGSLSITANNSQGKAALTTDDYLHVMSDGPVLDVKTTSSSAGHGLRGKDYILIDGGTITADVASNMKKGFSSDSLVVVTGGSSTIRVSGGAAYDSEDQEYTGSAGIKAGCAFKMTGGTVNITNSGTGGKGIKVGGSAEKGVYIFCSEVSGGTLDVKVTGSNYTAGDVSAKGIKAGWAVKGSTKAGPGGMPGGGGGMPGGGGGMPGGGTTYSAMTGDFRISGGSVSVTCTANEAFEVKKTLTVTGGELFASSAADDAINTASTFTVSGGKVCGISTANDGLDANGNFYIQGGWVYGSGAGAPELAIDANTEGGFKLYIQGGTVVAVGGVESGASISQKSSYSSWSRNTWYGLTAGSTRFAFKTPSSGGNSLYVYGDSTPSVKSQVNVSGTSFWGGYGNTAF